MSRAKLQDCLDTLGPGHEAECAELEKREREMMRNLQTMPTRSGQRIDPSALVVKGLDLPPGWRVSPGGTWRKRVADRRAFLWQRGGGYQIQLLEMGIPFIPTTGRSRYKTAGTAAQVAEDFLSGVGGEYMSLVEAEEAARLGGGVQPANPEMPESDREGSQFEMTKPESLKSVIRRSVGIPAPGSRPAFRRKAEVSGPLRRVAPQPYAPRAARVARAVDQALDPLRRTIADLAAQVEAGGPNRDPIVSRTAAPTYEQLSRMRKSGALQTRSAPRQAQASGGYVARTIPNSHNAGSGRPTTALSVRSAVRRSVGLGYRRPVEVVGRSVRDAIRIEGVKHDHYNQARAMIPPPTLETRSYRDPLTGQKYATAEAARFWHEANRKPDGVAFHAPK